MTAEDAKLVCECQYLGLEKEGLTAGTNPNVVGVGIGRKDGKDCIRVYVEKDSPKILAALPTDLEDVPVEIVISGAFKAL